jgi:tetratricopeptide (TPR) repeat protein
MVERIEQLIEDGRYFEAHIMAKDYCAEHPDDLRALQLCGLAMSKSGARDAAIEFLEPVLEKNANDVETAGILGGVYKEQFKKTAESEFARKSHETYLSNFEKTRNYYTGINAATMSQILGRGIAAREVARDVVDIALRDDDFWAIATLGEAYLLLKEPVKAYETYKQAAQLGAGHFGKMGSVYAQLLILKHYIVVPERVVNLFAPPNIAVFSGHMIDNNRDEPRFPASIENQVKEGIKQELVKHNIKIGYSSIACGGDILFIEALKELGGEVNLYLPFKREDFLETSVSFAGSDWVARFNRIEEENNVTYLTQSAYEGNDLFFRFLGQVMIGASIMRGSLFHTTPYLFTVASERETNLKAGGTNSVRTTWPYEQNTINVNPDTFLTADVADGEGKVDHQRPLYTTPLKNKLIQFFVFATLVNDNNEKDGGG